MAFKDNGATEISPEAIKRFGLTTRENIATGETPFRKAHLRSVVDCIEVDGHVIRIVGDKTMLEQAAGEKSFVMPEVRSFERENFQIIVFIG